MKVLAATAFNFQSYSQIAFDYNDLGLTLVSGPTGAGKSTILDLVPWVLYGITSKEGAADEVRTWGADRPTTGHVMVETPGGVIGVFRARGKPSNDLHWIEYTPRPSDPIRGKDMTDTQKLLEARLGVSADLFLTGSYMAQFSKADTFFIAKAKDRREVMEKIADQEFAINLGEKASIARKAKKAEIAEIQTLVATLSGKQLALEDLDFSLNTSKLQWEDGRVTKLLALSAKHESFETDKNADLLIIQDIIQNTSKKVKPDEYFTSEVERLESLSAAKNIIQHKIQSATADMAFLKRKTGPCPSCKRPMSNEDSTAHVEELKRQIELLSSQLAVDDYITQLKRARLALEENTKYKNNVSNLEDRYREKEAGVSPYEEQMEALAEEENPFTEKQQNVVQQLKQVFKDVFEAKAKLATLEHEFASLTWLYDKSFELRGLLMQKAVKQIEDSTNKYLERHFDAALRVQFSLEDSDKLEVAIFNDGNVASFRQLSGGERCMLKLCFTLSLMRAAQNKAGVSFGAIMLDEPLNGLDEGLKSKAFGLLQELEKEYPTVLVIEHSAELKQHFSKVFTVEKSGGYSTVEQS